MCMRGAAPGTKFCRVHSTSAAPPPRQCASARCATLVTGRAQWCPIHTACVIAPADRPTHRPAHRPVSYTHKKCIRDKCTSNVRARDLCIRHGAYGVCNRDGCKTMAACKRGLCVKHGAYGVCSHVGCKHAIRASGVCGKHGAICIRDGCTSVARTSGLCTKHGAYGLCSRNGCKTAAVGHGLCVKHGAYGICAHTGCTTAPRSNGRCHKHRMAPRI